MPLVLPSDKLFPAEDLYPGGEGVRGLTARTLEMLDMIPPQFQGSFYIQAAFLAMSNELDRIDAKVSEIIDTFFPQLAGEFIYLWEAQLKIGEAHLLTIPQRQLRVMATMIATRRDSSAEAWVNNVTALIGPNWTYRRFEPPGGEHPPGHTIEVEIPYKENSPQASDLIQLLQKIAPANTDFIIDYGTGFVVEQSQIQAQPL